MSGLPPWIVASLVLLSACFPVAQTDAPGAGSVTPDMVSSGPPFPRLGMWLPNPWQQPLEEIARYDWVILDEWASQFNDQLKELNPALILLNYVHPADVGFGDPVVRRVPPAWYLTQVGTVLRDDADAAQTVLPVEALTVSDGETTFELFVPGETALLDGESVYVESVDRSERTLTVQRGYYRPASTHVAGTRIAAHVTFWPGTWLMNMATGTPQGVADEEIGEETWVEFNARVAAAQYEGPTWDGLAIDGPAPGVSNLYWSSGVRTLDFDQSNRLVTDRAHLDAAWADGARQFLELVRELVGPEAILYLSNSGPWYDQVNGNNFEAFPSDAAYSFNEDWHTTVFGPRPSGGGSYLEWLAEARQPNLTHLCTFEDDWAFIAGGDLAYDNPAAHSDFAPNYRKMRFGLVTAMLGDGYFSYTISTLGGGSLGLMWFDEYDNGGAERGYLGYPLGPAWQLTDVAVAPEMLAGSGLDCAADLEWWALWVDASYEATVIVDDAEAGQGQASARIDIGDVHGSNWRVSFSQAPLTLTADGEYTLIFQARADRERTARVWLQERSEPYRGPLSRRFEVGTEWQEYEFHGVSPLTDHEANLVFAVGEAGGSIWLDEVHLYAGGLDVWRRDYEGGIVLVNATSQAVTIQLEGEFRKIAGTQDPQVNDGSLVTEVTLPSLDGIVLLRP